MFIITSAAYHHKDKLLSVQFPVFKPFITTTFSKICETESKIVFSYLCNAKYFFC